jgi:hypothetical protein
LPVHSLVTGRREGGNGPALLFFVSVAVTVALVCGTVACGSPPGPPVQASRPAPATPPQDVRDPKWASMLDDVEKRTFDFFWERANPKNGLVPDRWPSDSFSSIAAVGFALTAYTIGAERGWVTREAARERVLTTLRFFAKGSAGGGAAGGPGFHGFYYHFLDMDTGARFKDVELSTIDTTLFLAGALTCQSWFDRDDPAEAEIRSLADSLYRAADWTWAQKRKPLVSMGWTPDGGLSDWDWRGYNEAMVLYVLALGSPTHAVEPAAWTAYTSTYKWETFEGQSYVGFGPLFGYQYSHVWIDFRGIRDAYMRGKGIDYFENSRRATYTHRQWAIDNRDGWRGYGPTVWGFTACDGPIDGDFVIDGKKRHFFTYAARAASAHEVRDDGTIAPTGAASSLPFAPEIVLPAMEEMRAKHGENLFGKYGYLDAFNPTFTLGAPPVHHGKVAGAAGWFDTDYLGIDQGPILAMVENARSELVWKTMRKNPYVVQGLKRAGFTGGWLDSAR